ncbi:MAG TPA: hypothetical protein PK965_05915 [Anaerohalosphaeraceae bacterium]|nr:hypothetical protein [Anaerohalosphaeraceae bacterium]
MPQKAMKILMVRWPEALMLTGLFGGLSCLAARMNQEAVPQGLLAQMPLWAGFLFGVGLMILIILIGMLFTGFLRSTVLAPLSARHPVELLQIGRPFFWKLFLPYLVFELAWSFLSILLMMLLHMLLYRRLPTEPTPEWLLRVCQLIVLCILIKPFLLLPTLILLENRPVTETLAVIRRIPLTAVKPLMKVLEQGLVVMAAFLLLLFVIPFPKPFFWVRSGLLNTAGGAVLLVCFLTALQEFGQFFGPHSEEKP